MSQPIQLTLTQEQIEKEYDFIRGISDTRSDFNKKVFLWNYIWFAYHLWMIVVGTGIYGVYTMRLYTN